MFFNRNSLLLTGLRLVFVFLFLLSPMKAIAQSPFVGCGSACTLADLLSVPARVYNWSTGLASGVLLALIAFAGVRILLFYFSDKPESELNAAKMMLRHALFGFAIVMLSWLIVYWLLTRVFGIGGAGFFRDVFGTY
ncbi:MAG: hypothetical protein COT71_00170 [Candidatus Andersenbacteria bacterium CG10_big_fil_rev_8_21_14_0_10_54_11]|uniref:Uncharacterized protein n=1 Tax=Candidatus Andersenbacteria bacterium CG10_big_fil_rev_8_21_14_0_10_54_11 TaxID=1974485 RepID=A0A2M6X0K4_9BACT|nr:MAG: hypothetical protein COT71_00170 [Candidatus Andersenbacteria bacterium CG10_big_fil_rev_8_21_14_0_10_54_11]